jgi:proteasome lid subunit RPN8/RPN11
MNESGGRANLKVWGSPEDNRVVIYIDKRAYNAIQHHGAANPQREVVGILMGSVSEDSSGKYRVDIVGIVKSQSAPGNQTQAQFTNQVWLELVGIAQREYPNQKVVGWYHTHPGFGAFLSGDDASSHKVAFSHPWHVAAVCDPIKGELCFFGWDGSELKAIKGFYTYEVPVKKPEPLPRPEKMAPSPSWNPAFLIPVLILFLAAFVTVGVFLTRSPSGHKEISQLHFADQPAATASFLNEGKGEVYAYFIQKSGDVWCQTLRLNESEFTWNKEISLPITFKEIVEQPNINAPKGGNAIGTLAMQAKDGNGKLWVLSADISDAGKLGKWQKTEASVKPPPTPADSLSVSKTLLVFGPNEDTTELQISFTGSGKVPWKVSRKPDWINMEMGGIRIEKDAPQSTNANSTVAIKVTAIRTGLKPDDNQGEIVFNYGNGTKELKVAIVVTVAALLQPMPSFQIVGVKDEDGNREIPKDGERVFVRVKNKGTTQGEAVVSAPHDNKWEITGTPSAGQTIPAGAEVTFEFKLKPKKSGWQSIDFVVNNRSTENDEYGYSAEFKQP